jgi:hypothetical protein
MYCYHCGKEIPDDSIYCPYCGSEQKHGGTEQEEKTEGFYQEAPEYDHHAEQMASYAHTTHVFSILALVFGAIGGLIGPIFGIISLTRHPSNQDKAMDIVGISCYVLWMIFAVVYAILIVEGVVPNPYSTSNYLALFF